MEAKHTNSQTHRHTQGHKMIWSSVMYPVVLKKNHTACIKTAAVGVVPPSANRKV